MAHYEIDSFVIKFKHLWCAGNKATLKIEAVDGQASVILMAGLGHPLHPMPLDLMYLVSLLANTGKNVEKQLLKLLTVCLLPL